MRTRILLVTVVALLLGAAAASANLPKHYFPRPHHHCRLAYHKHYVRVWERINGQHVRVRRRACYRDAIQYRAKVDPSFTQDPSNPLAVTYDYSADTTATYGATAVDLAAANQLPAGILNFYSSQTPGGPEQLYCSVNVGGSSSDGACPISYSDIGTYEVTTQYIPNGTTAVTQTEQETISPFSTATALSVAQVGCGAGSAPGYTVPGPWCEYTLINSVTDQNGSQVSGPAELDFSTDSGQYGGGGLIPANGSCTVYVTPSWVLSPNASGGCNFEAGSGLYNAASWTVATSFLGKPGWTASSAESQMVVP